MRYTIEMTQLHGKVQPCLVVHHDDLKDDPKNPRWERVTDWEDLTVSVKYPKSKYPLPVRAFNAYTDGTANPEDLNDLNYLLAVLGFEPVTIEQLAA